MKAPDRSILDEAREIFYKDPNIIGIGIGQMRVNNEIRDDEYALLIYVAHIYPGYKIPKDFMGLKTNIIDPLSYFSSTTVDVMRDHIISADLGNIDWGRLHELHMPNASLVQNLTAKVRDFGDVCVVEDDGTFVKTKPDGSLWIDYLEPYRLFRTIHGDDYDFVTFFPDGSFPNSSSFSVGIHNDVQGIGLGPYDTRAYWRSVRLQQFHSIRIGHFPYWRHTMLQELAHRWGCYANYKDPITGDTKSDHRLPWPLDSHWSNEFDDDKSPMDYNSYEWIELPNGQFRQVFLTSDQHVYSGLDLYLMGLRDSNDVGEFKILRDVQPVSGSFTDFTANPVTLNVQDFINHEGVRIPSSSDSPKYWREAFVVLTSDINQVQTFVNTVDSLRIRWKNDFIEATEGLGKIDTFLSTLFRLTHISNIVAVGAYYADIDQHQHALVATSNKVSELWWSSFHGEQGALTQWHANNIKDSAFTLPHWEGVLIDDTPGNIVAIAGYYSNNDQYQHTIVATTNGKVQEFYWNPAVGGQVGQDVVTQFPSGSVVAIAGYYSNNDQYQHTIVATTNGKVQEFYWNPAVGGQVGQDVVTQFPSGSVVAIAGYWANIDDRHHTIVASKDGKVYEIYWKSGQAGIEGQYVLTEFPSGSIVAIAGYYAENDKRQHVIVGTRDGSVRDFSFISHL
jgi:hypothetical protein